MKRRYLLFTFIFMVVLMISNIINAETELKETVFLEGEAKTESLMEGNVSNILPTSEAVEDAYLIDDSGTLLGLKEDVDVNTLAKEGIITLPSVVDGKTVVRIKAAAFKSKALVGELVIPESIVWIEPEAFMDNQLTKVHFHSKLGPIGPKAFFKNKITEVDLSMVTGLKGSRWSRELNYENAGILSWQLFGQNEIDTVKLNEKIWAIGVGSFSKNKITKLHIPSHIKNIYASAFYMNEQLTDLTFDVEAQGLQIDFSAFRNCSITKLELPVGTGEIGGYAFAYNKISDLKLPQGLIILGYNAFTGCPIENLELRNCRYILESEPFSETQKLKNITFNDFKNSAIVKGMFANGLLKSIEIPSTIKEIVDRNSMSYSNPFYENSGWHASSKKVALYRKDDGTYNMTDDLEDGAYHSVNPVLVDFLVEDQYGQPVPEAKIKVESLRLRKDATEALADETDWGKFGELFYRGKLNTQNHVHGDVDAVSYKLGDKLKISLTLPNDDWKQVTTDLQLWPGNVGNTHVYELILDPSNDRVIKEEGYADDYAIGFKKAEVHFVLNNPQAPIVPEPLQPYIPEEDKEDEKDSEPSSLPDEAIPSNPEEKISSEEIPQGNNEVQNEIVNKTEEKVPNSTEIVEAEIPEGKSHLPQTSGLPMEYHVLTGCGLILLASILKRKK